MRPRQSNRALPICKGKHVNSIAKYSATLLLCLLGTRVEAFAPPERGIYWNPAESGKGWAIDVQDNLVFVAHFTFQPTGGASAPATFYTTIGTWDYVGNRFTGDLLEFQGGPCITCGPSTAASRNLGRITFSFTTREIGTISFGGRTTPIQKLLYAYSTEARSIFNGVFNETFGALGVYFGDVIRFTGTCTSVSLCGGIAGAFFGYRVDGDANRILLGAPIPGTREVLILLDSSADFWREYRVTFYLNVYAGTSRTYLKGTSPSAGGLTLVGSRILGGPNDAAAVSPPRPQPPKSAVDVSDNSDVGSAERDLRILSLQNLAPTSDLMLSSVIQAAAAQESSSLPAATDAQVTALREKLEVAIRALAGNK